MEEFDNEDFNYDFDTVEVLFVPDPPHVPRRGVPINAYKAFKAFDRYGNSYYISGVNDGY